MTIILRESDLIFSFSKKHDYGLAILRYSAKHLGKAVFSEKKVFLEKGPI